MVASMVIGIFNAIKSMMAKTSGEGSLMALEYVNEYQKFNGSIKKISKAQIEQEFVHNNMKETFQDISLEEVEEFLKDENSAFYKKIKALREETDTILNEEQNILSSITESVYFLNEPPIDRYIEEYKDSKDKMDTYINNQLQGMPKEIVLKRMRDQYGLLYVTIDRLVLLVNELKVSTKIKEPEQKDTFEKPLESVRDYYKDQYDFFIKKLEELSRDKII
ncbi:TPA: hypothetical protein QCX35_005872 [Bacillus toyonensis]|uniref:hypothetical protein n=1 Tax=Bacillus TaxID=1386 RepID=UPI00103CF3B3|nr:MULTISPECIES: hypothetical protein [Bacillus]MBJ8066367.1 hypothetical protein [Bacillus cereus group sp. N15]MCS3598046.1 ElaB/YqjD/DUF883 family membrane-anchored ribosome-binding protein [Bacillus sp. JUb91]TBX43958.1 hypothetical protein E0M44_22115 [Bacillus toyonensis]HDR7449641.1 hypothetical protein [Bacillus toyonensis]